MLDAGVSPLVGALGTGEEQEEASRPALPTLVAGSDSSGRATLFSQQGVELG